MLNIVIILIFSVAMLVFMVFPAMKLTQWLKAKTTFSEKFYTILQILLTIFLSLLIGLFLKFA